MIKILFFGDIVGKAGRQAIKEILPRIREKHKVDLVIANAENLAHGKGVTVKTIEEMINAGVDIFTSGNHVYDKPEAAEVFKKYGEKILRPANFEDAVPGNGYEIVSVGDHKVLVINMHGEVFMEKQYEGKISNPFIKLEEILKEVPNVKIRVLDFHAEATSEKRGIGFWADGKLSGVVGTHTHVQTADAQILPGGTGYITDLGMTGAADSIIGVSKESALKRFLVQGDLTKGVALEIAEGDKYEVGYVIMEIDELTGKCKNINRYLEFFANDDPN